MNVMPFDYDVRFAGAPVRARNLSAGQVEDLTVNIYDRADGRGLLVDYDANPALYTKDGLAAHQDRFTHLVGRLAEADPHLPLAAHTVAAPGEVSLILAEFNRTERELPATNLIGPIEAQTRRTPAATALVYGEESLSYAELNARANRLARHLRTLGARPDTVVALSVPRSVELIVTLLAILKTGAAYLPLDPDYPERRLLDMVRDAAPVCAVTDRAGRLPDDGATPLVVLDGLDVSAQLPTDPCRPLTPSHPAYVIYTSGSTGRPKGVVVSHGAIDSRLRWMQDTYRLTAGEGVAEDAVLVRRVGVGVLLAAARGRDPGRRGARRAPRSDLSGPPGARTGRHHTALRTVDAPGLPR